MYEKNEARNDELSTADMAGGADKPESSTVTSAVAAVPAKTSTAEEQSAPLLSSDEAKDLHTRWDTIQAGFVDEPRQAVEKADNLVAESIKRLADMFAEERAKLEGQWDRGDNVSTEDLRIALRRYRSFFNRLLSI